MLIEISTPKICCELMQEDKLHFLLNYFYEIFLKGPELSCSVFILYSVLYRMLKTAEVFWYLLYDL